MKNNPALSWIGTTITGIFTYLSMVELKDLITWILSILAAAITIAYTLYSWYKKATKDGKITKDEIDDLIEDMKHKGGKHDE